MTRRGVLAITSAAIVLFSMLAGASPVAAGSASGAAHNKRVCAATPAGYAACHSRVVTDANLHPLATTTWGNRGYSPDQLRAAYGLTTDSTTKVAIVDAYANPNAAPDLAFYRAAFNIGGTGTLTQYNQTGDSISTVSGNVGWGQEEMLDLEMVSAICPSCQIIYVGANSNSFNDLATAVDQAFSLGAKVISNSYGGSEFRSESLIAGHYSHPGVAITVSSGDSGYGVQIPSALRVRVVPPTAVTVLNAAGIWTP